MRGMVSEKGEGMAGHHAQYTLAILDEASGMIGRFFKEAKNPRSSFLEHAREIDFPLYDPDFRRFAPRYFMNSWERLSMVEQFGLDGEKISRMMGKVKRDATKRLGIEEGQRVGEDINNLVDIMMNTVRTAPADERASLYLRSFMTLRLAFSAIINVGQSITNVAFATDLPTLV